ncbi:hypothetical protein WOLCODRAFT_28419 [Wolfiporia cocos MD-104 SS10]|uniref:Uncharacterized protein n=1 Tax=Wolfiporia cocos (strain MD-104) TaxID=742152 RepID=A0A2H3JBY9_WOLCO|nr:hypothetical protein WOLCODRAFT_28419 [Wolfiporia cocos MD-104 SS10]
MPQHSDNNRHQYVWTLPRNIAPSRHLAIYVRAAHDAPLTSAGQQSAMLLTSPTTGIRVAEHSLPTLPSARCL